jgi:methionyl-tRNA formyltransferase
MRIIFMGSPDFAVPTLDAIVAGGHEVICAYTRPPRPAGRGKGDRPTAVSVRAEALGIEVRTPRSLRGAAEQEAFAELEADAAVVAAYGLILPQPTLDAPRHGCLNVHATGVTIMQMEAGLDTGPMLLRRSVEIGDRNAAQLTEKLAKLGAAMMAEVLADLPRFEPIPQPEEGVTYASKIGKQEARIDWTRPANELVRHVQGLAPFPGAWFQANGERIKLLAATAVPGMGAPGEVLDGQLSIACGDGAVRPSLLQRAGKGAMSADELLRGFPIPKGAILQ